MQMNHKPFILANGWCKIGIYTMAKISDLPRAIFSVPKIAKQVYSIRLAEGYTCAKEYKNLSAPSLDAYEN